MKDEEVGQKRACLIYVTATAGGRAAVRDRLEAQGFIVCEVKADIEDALAAQAGDTDIPVAVAECIGSSNLCVFLLPEDPGQDGGLGLAAGLANQGNKPVVGVVSGARATYPDQFDEEAQSMVREDSERLDDAICGTEVWENPDRSPVADRPIKHIRCQ